MEAGDKHTGELHKCPSPQGHLLHGQVMAYTPTPAFMPASFHSLAGILTNKYCTYGQVETNQ